MKNDFQITIEVKNVTKNVIESKINTLWVNTTDDCFYWAKSLSERPIILCKIVFPWPVLGAMIIV